MAYPGDPERPLSEPDPTSFRSGGEPDPATLRSGSIPELRLLLDPAPPDSPIEQLRSKRLALTPARRAFYGTLAGLLLIGSTFAVLIVTRAPATRAPAARTAVQEAAPRDGHVEPRTAPLATAPAPPHVAPMPGPWRVAELAGAPDHKLVEGTVERRPFVDALRDSGVPKAQIYRIVDAFRGVKTFDKTKPRDTFVVALDLPSRKVQGFEYQMSPTEIYQARARDDGSLVGNRLDLHIENKRVATAIAIGDDLAGSLTAAGLDSSMLEELDDALEGRTQLSSIRPGSRLRLVADYETALGVFARYTDLDAVELTPAGGNTEPVRVYHYKGRNGAGYYDARAHQPYKGGFRTPIPFARISSRFNMHRMHPILHVVRPHNGVDFAAASGTPVYAAAAGTIETIGDSGPSGNLITIKHGSGLTTGYAHLSRFAPRLSVGQAVDARQLIGYSGSTGRSTGPHLHFSTKKNGVFIDPLTLKLDGDRVLPKSERDAFDEQRAQLDRALDAVALPSGPVIHAEPGETDDQEPLDDVDHDH